MKPIVFFTRCRPWGDSDAIELSLKHNIVFVGWPVWKQGEAYQPGNMTACIADPSAVETEWREVVRLLPADRRRHAAQNRNLIADVVPGSIVLIPRPQRGVVYAGRIEGAFELVNDPPWAADYLRLRRDQGLPLEPEGDLIADVVQCWRVDRFRPVPFPAIPAWVRKSLFGRSTFGRIHAPGVMGLEPYELLDTLIDEPRRVLRPPTNELAEVERRLVTDVGPSSFEHLCVALLQMEHPDEVWTHVGGSGDGGVDGIGAGFTGAVEGLLQCKWAYWGGPVDFANPWRHDPSKERRLVLASLLHPDDVAAPDGVQFWSRHSIAELVVKHANHLSQALSMRVTA